MIRFHISILVVPLLLSAPAFAHPAPLLELPLLCPPSGCFLARTLDHQPEKGVDADYRCGPRAGNDHDGTDIAVTDMVEAAATRVVAAAAGTVVATRDGMPDQSMRGRPAEELNGKDCGNGVVIDHGGDWQTQYCHLRQGSIAVHKGQGVAAGDVLGTVGMSGRSEFPHVHLVVRHHGTRIDPFNGQPDSQPCSSAAAHLDSLWSPAARAALPYAGAALYHAGFSGEAAPTVEKARNGDYRQAPAADSPVLLLWMEMMAARAGDRLEMTLFAPDGSILVRQQPAIKESSAQNFLYVGLRRKADRWPAGLYRGEVRLLRQGELAAPVLVVSTRIAP